MSDKAKKITQPAIDRRDYKPKLDASGRPKLTYYPDAGKPGLVLVVQPSGKMSWVIFYRRLSDRKQRKLTLDGFPSLATAHKLAQTALDGVAEGKDPAGEKKELKRIAKAGVPDRDQFRAVVERYTREYAAKRRNGPEKARLIGLRTDPENKTKWQAIPGRAVDLWGQKRIHDIARRDIKEHLERLVSGAPIGANRTFSELRKFFNWTVSQDILPASPMVGMSPPTDLQEEADRRRHRTLLHHETIPGSTDEELRWLWKACDAYDKSEETSPVKLRGPFGPLVKLLILTGQRRSEVAEMTWSELDLEKRQWVIPAARSKNGKPHLVPLSSAAFEILEKLPRIAGKAGHVFTTNGQTPVSGYSRMKRRIDTLMAEAAERERGETVPIAEWRLHDLRRTMAAGMQRLGVALEVTEKVLNHTSGSFAGIVGVYQVHEYAREKAAALESWGQFVTRLVNTAPVSDEVAGAKGQVAA